MRRSLAAAFAVLALAACSNAPEPTPTPSATSSATTSTQDVAYLTQLRATVTGGTDPDLIRIGKEACTRLATSTDLDVASWLVEQKFSTADAAAITAASRQVYCP